jgi:hypothetical protein
VGTDGTGGSVATSSDGVTWTDRTAVGSSWVSVTYGTGTGDVRFVAASRDNGTNNIMTSPDGITWTLRSSATTSRPISVTFGDGLFVAVTDQGSGTQRVQTSPDGINWTLRTTPNVGWTSVAYGTPTINGTVTPTFVAVTTNGIMTSSGSSGSGAGNGGAGGNGGAVGTGGTGGAAGQPGGTTGANGQNGV